MTNAASPTEAQSLPVVLMVDDDLDLLEEYRELLECDGICAAICDDPYRALDMVRDTPSIGFVLTDLRMDGLNGAELIVRMRTEFPSRALSFALITGATEVRPGLCGPDVHIVYKPVSGEDLVALIDRAP